jgi:hypothetical protein
MSAGSPRILFHIRLRRIQPASPLSELKSKAKKPDDRISYDYNSVEIEKSFAQFAKSAGGYRKQWSKWKIGPWSSPIRIYRASRPKCSIFSGEQNYVKQIHALQRVKTMNHPLPFRSCKGLMENEMCSILDRKNPVKICPFGLDD